MPSVRVKRTDYAQLDDQVVGTPPAQLAPLPRSVANIFSAQRRPGSSGEPTNISLVEPQVRPRRATVAGCSDTPMLPIPPQVTIRRPRAGSRVADHVMSRASMVGLRNRRSALSMSGGGGGGSGGGSRPSSARRTPVPSGMELFDGAQAGIMLPSVPGASGILQDNLSGTHTGFSETDEEGHHHDDVVEHLDVIDPQVATVSNLTNAANAILIPALPFYSRRPVVILGSPTQEQLEGALERGELPRREVDRHDDALDRHVEDILARPSKLKRTLRGVWSFLKTPMGIVTGIYGFCVVFWGAAIVFFLAKFINFHNANTQGFWVEVSSQVVNGLFTVTGIGLIPARVMDTYRIYKIWRYKRRTAKLRAKADLPQLYDNDDLPDPAYDPNYVHVLSDKEQMDLHKKQEKFRQSQTWYRPHGTETHRAFPINTALLICLFTDGNSIFQIILCGTMWGLNRFQRPAWSTGILIPASFLCGIIAIIFIWRGNQKTKRTKEVEQRLRMALAMEQGHYDEFPASPEEDLRPNRARNGSAAAKGVVTGPNTSGPPFSQEKGTENLDRDTAIDEHMTIPSLKGER